MSYLLIQTRVPVEGYGEIGLSKKQILERMQDVKDAIAMFADDPELAEIQRAKLPAFQKALDEINQLSDKYGAENVDAIEKLREESDNIEIQFEELDDEYEGVELALSQKELEMKTYLKAAKNPSVPKNARILRDWDQDRVTQTEQDLTTYRKKKAEKDLKKAKLNVKMEETNDKLLKLFKKLNKDLGTGEDVPKLNFTLSKLYFERPDSVLNSQAVVYEDRRINLYISFIRYGPSEREPTGSLYLEYFKSQQDTNLPRAPPGYAKEAFCKIMAQFLRDGFIKKNTTMSVHPVDITRIGDVNLLRKKVYEPMGFRYLGELDDYMYTTCGTIIKWCEGRAPTSKKKYIKRQLIVKGSMPFDRESRDEGYRTELGGLINRDRDDETGEY